MNQVQAYPLAAWLRIDQLQRREAKLLDALWNLYYSYEDSRGREPKRGEFERWRDEEVFGNHP